MSDWLAVDTNAVIDFLRPDRTPPPQLGRNSLIALPLPVAGELFGGAHSSRRTTSNLERVEELAARWTLLLPDLGTARIYGRLRGEVRDALSTSRMNDLWIAAICLQYELPLLTNDRGFSAIPDLSVITW